MSPVIPSFFPPSLLFFLLLFVFVLSLWQCCHKMYILLFFFLASMRSTTAVSNLISLGCLLLKGWMLSPHRFLKVCPASSQWNSQPVAIFLGRFLFFSTPLTIPNFCFAKPKKKGPGSWCSRGKREITQAGHNEVYARSLVRQMSDAFVAGFFPGNFLQQTVHLYCL